MAFQSPVILNGAPVVPVDRIEDKTLVFGVALLDLVGRHLINRLTQRLGTRPAGRHLRMHHDARAVTGDR